MPTSTLPVISGHEIAIDQYGRYNLNSLHAASGGDDQKRPSKWTRTQSAKELVLEASKSESPNMGFRVLESRKGNGGGTFAIETLAVAYAAWISAKFHLIVLQTFIDYRTGRLNQEKQIERENCTLTYAHERGLQKAISRYVYGKIKSKEKRRAAFAAVHSYLKDRFQVASYKDIPEKKYTQALSAIEQAPLEGVWIGAEQKTMPDDGGIYLSGPEAYQVWQLCMNFNSIMSDFDIRLRQPLKRIGSNVAEDIFDKFRHGHQITYGLLTKFGNPEQPIMRTFGRPS
ncbi:hypothetical protein R84981_002785 [Carnimonas sp. R-84981]|uniref:KilA-N domain-containing protein n=1 Tax=Carnimonas bestiolae TaxID=3402172 RepID=UPI003EDC6E25